MNFKFKVKENAYWLLKTEGAYSSNMLAEGYLKLVKIYITKVGHKNLEGWYMHKYGDVLKYPGMEKNIITKKKKKNGKEVPFLEYEYVAIKKIFSIDSVYTFEEAKLKMIEYIATDFGNNNSFCSCNEE